MVVLSGKDSLRVTVTGGTILPNQQTETRSHEHLVVSSNSRPRAPNSDTQRQQTPLRVAAERAHSVAVTDDTRWLAISAHLLPVVQGA